MKKKENKMKILMIMLSGVALVNSQDMGKERFEEITGTKIVEQYKIIPSELVQQRIQENIQKELVAKKATAKKKKSSKKTKKVPSKKAKKVVKKKKVQKKRRKVVRRTYIRYDRIEIQHYAYGLVKSYGWSDYDFDCLVKLWYRESSWNPNAVNPKSGACGIPQSLPCRKMASEGSDYRTNYKTQVRWGLKYIKARYGSPSGAWSHSQQKGWY